MQVAVSVDSPKQYAPPLVRGLVQLLLLDLDRISMLVWAFAFALASSLDTHHFEHVLHGGGDVLDASTRTEQRHRCESLMKLAK